MNKKEIITALSEKYKVPESEIKKAYDSQFKFAAEKMTEDDLPAIRLPFFGIFKPNYKKIKKLNELKNNE